MDSRPRAAVARLDARGGELVDMLLPLLSPTPPPTMLSLLLLLLFHNRPKELRVLMIGIVDDGRKENASIVLQKGLMDIKLAIMAMAQPA
jgi:hypothetical protein